MPIFDFQCRACGSSFERLQMVRDEQVSCPDCGSDAVDKKVSLFTCTEIQLNKRLKLRAIDDMRSGQKMLEGQRMRKKRIKIL